MSALIELKEYVGTMLGRCQVRQILRDDGQWYEQGKVIWIKKDGELIQEPSNKLAIEMINMDEIFCEQGKFFVEKTHCDYSQCVFHLAYVNGEKIPPFSLQICVEFFEVEG